MASTLTEFTGRIVHASWFQRLIILTILLAGVLAGIETDAAMVASHGPVLRTLDAIVLGIFIIEVDVEARGALPAALELLPRRLECLRLHRRRALPAADGFAVRRRAAAGPDAALAAPRLRPAEAPAPGRRADQELQLHGLCGYAARPDVLHLRHHRGAPVRRP